VVKRSLIDWMVMWRMPAMVVIVFQCTWPESQAATRPVASIAAPIKVKLGGTPMRFRKRLLVNGGLPWLSLTVNFYVDD